MANGLKAESDVRRYSKAQVEGIERTFGDRPPQRGAWRVNPKTGELEELGARTIEARTQILTDGHYDGLRATDGTPIDTRQRHRAYMKANGLALHDDFKQEWADAPKRKVLEQQIESRERREQIGRAMHNPRPGRVGPIIPED